ncbi:Uncharacterised protein [Corynebacterium matruchotii]|nr:Uncharacterised protein [Corynebacterium matruchotii]
MKTRRNYLRVRGEYASTTKAISFSGELPPRARRILPVSLHVHGILGTTSACAENTQKTAYDYKDAGNYLRVRGEYPISRNRNDSSSELPPRARRILTAATAPPDLLGTTSACAENTTKT